VDDEALEVRVGPAEGAQDEVVQKSDRGITADEEAVPDQRTGCTEANPELVDLGRGNGHTAPHDTRAADRGAVPRR
jgi:hypothetical protein